MHVVVAIAKQMSSFFDYLETGGNKASTLVIGSQQNSTESNETELAECGFAGYWNIKGCGYMVRDFNRKLRGLTAIRCGAFLAIAPQMCHTKKSEDHHEKTAN